MKLFTLGFGLALVSMQAQPVTAPAPVIDAGAVPDECGDAESAAYWNSGRDAAYRDANDLKRKLEARGLHVECIRSSVEAHLFEGQKGAAWFRTSDGVFEAWFLATGGSFDNLQITEEQSGPSRFVYLFRGMEHVPPVMDSSRRIWFIKDGPVLVKVWGDARLARKLQSVFLPNEARIPDGNGSLHSPL